MEKHYQIIGLAYNGGVTPIANFSTDKLAKNHIKNTFSDLGYNQLLVKAVPALKNDPLFIPDEIANDNAQYVLSRISMNVLNWEALRVVPSFGTLTRFLAQPTKVITKVSELDKISEVSTESVDSVGEVSEISVTIAHSAETAIPYTKISRKLQKRATDILTGKTEVTFEEEVLAEEDPEATGEPVSDSNEDTPKDTKAVEKAHTEPLSESEGFTDIDTAMEEVFETVSVDVANNEAEIKAKEEAEIKAKELEDIKAKEEAEIKAKELEDIKAKEEAEIKAKELEDIKAKEEAEIKAKEEAEIKAKELEDIKSKEEAEIGETELGKVLENLTEDVKVEKAEPVKPKNGLEGFNISI